MSALGDNVVNRGEDVSLPSVWKQSSVKRVGSTKVGTPRNTMLLIKYVSPKQNTAKSVAAMKKPDTKSPPQRSSNRRLTVVRQNHQARREKDRPQDHRVFLKRSQSPIAIRLIG